MKTRLIQNYNFGRGARWLGVALLVVVLSAVAGCGGGGPAAQAGPTTAAGAGGPTPTDDAAVPYLGEAVATVAPAATVVVATAAPTEPPTPAATATADGGVVVVPAVEPAIDPAATPVPFDVAGQPPYEASECSDRYPCNDDVDGWEARVQVPEGFAASYFARVDGQPNVLTFGPDGLLYVGTMAGEIFTIDENGAPALYVDGFIAPAGLAFQPGTERLYVSSRVVDVNEGGEAKVAVVEDGVVTDLITGLPCCYTAMHSANGIAFGPDGYGYVAVGGRADHGEILSGPRAGEQDELDPREASILRFSPDGATVEPYARGFRNSYDIAWDGDGALFAADNMPDFGPPEEFNRVEPGGEHGYPWFDCDVCFQPPADVAIVPPLHTFVAQSAPTGVAAYLDDEFPGFYNSLFVTLWSAFPEAQRVVWFGPGGEATATFATGFAAPIDLTVGPDGALYVADWATGIIFRIAYGG
ncbi:MAG: PQQ-dependent sugar dehydrogenase [Chloroflexota bacterium]